MNVGVGGMGVENISSSSCAGGAADRVEGGRIVGDATSETALGDGVSVQPHPITTAAHSADPCQHSQHSLHGALSDPHTLLVRD
jgi:hypothetical protein